MSGIIDLMDISGNIMESKKYRNTEHRKEIIDDWKSSNLKKNSKFLVSIFPEEKELPYLSGYVSVVFGKIQEKRFYRNREHREMLIEEMVTKHSLKIYSIQISPHL